MEFFTAGGCYLLCLLMFLDFYYVDSANFKCPRIDIPNGYSRLRIQRRTLQFRCFKGFTRVGPKMAICLKAGQWSQKIPLCVGRGCPAMTLPKTMKATSMYRGGMLQFQCEPGYTRQGPEQVFCDGKNWNKAPPVCQEGMSMGCDFEDEGLCGWSQVLREDKLDWIWHKGATPTKNTGPSTDHTTGTKEGHYMFIESSSPSKKGQSAQLISPSYDPKAMVGVCMEFYYHLYGHEEKEEIGNLRLFLKPKIVPLVRLHSDRRVIALFKKDSNQGDYWHHFEFKVPVVNQPFQFVFEAQKQISWLSDVSIDDIRLFNCTEETTTEMPTTTPIATTIPPTTTPLPTTTTTTTTIATTPRVRRTTTTPMETTWRRRQTTTTPMETTWRRRRTTTTPIETTWRRRRTTTTPMETTWRRRRTTTTPIETTWSWRRTTTTPIETTWRRRRTTTTPMETTTTWRRRSSTTITSQDASPPSPDTIPTTATPPPPPITTSVPSSSSSSTVEDIVHTAHRTSTSGSPHTPALQPVMTSSDTAYASASGSSSSSSSFSSSSSPSSSPSSSTSGEDKHVDVTKVSTTDVPEGKKTTISTSDSGEIASSVMRTTPTTTTADTPRADVGKVRDKANDSTAGTEKLLPLILGVVGAVLLVAIVIAVLAHKLSTKRRMKEEKETEDQMNIISDYVETTLSH